LGHAASWIRTAISGSVVRRAVGYGIVVGAVLIAINHGDAIVAGRVDASRVLKMALTVLVPYCVSTASSVGAILDDRR
jgi:NAD/NADP transhydrogenase alpha subunit